MNFPKVFSIDSKMFKPDYSVTFTLLFYFCPTPSVNIFHLVTEFIPPSS